ncbi:MAG TPA: low temperature requirement protein A [Solirubrobacterales bacterium]|nr:low temperature requirement protein A [Solirubrobacterales bacterium]
MSNDELRVSTLELFFDLVFVFTITQLTAVLVHHPDGEALGQVVLMLSAIWWMYGAFAWLTNAVPPDRTSLRLPLLGGMLAFFAISVTIPTAFTEDAVVFACAYLVVIAVHTVLYMQSASWTVTGVWSFARMNIVAGAIILVGAILGGAAEYVLWGLAVVIFVVVPAMVPEEAGWIRPDHFVERHGLVVMVALGESVVAVGIGASGLDVTWELLAVAVLGLTLSAELWWVYFLGDQEESEGALRAMTPTRREFYATNVAFYWAHLLMLLGIVCLAAGLEHAIGHAFDELSFARALALGGGAALFLAGHALFRRMLGLRFKPWRALALVLALGTIALGPATSALAQLAVLVAALAVCIAAEGIASEKTTGGRSQTLLRPSDLAS